MENYSEILKKRIETFVINQTNFTPTQKIEFEAILHAVYHEGMVQYLVKSNMYEKSIKK